MENERGPRICIAVSSEETKCYCNKSALLSLAEKLKTLSVAPPEDFYELHVRLAMSLNPNLKEGQFTSDNVWVVQNAEPVNPDNDRLTALCREGAVPFGFELTFMHVSEDVLDVMRAEAGSSD